MHNCSNGIDTRGILVFSWATCGESTSPQKSSRCPDQLWIRCLVVKITLADVEEC